MSPSQVVIAPAKLTLSLRVVGVRPDGYHLIDAEMTTLGLHDVLHLAPRHDEHSSVSYTGRWAEGLAADGTDLVSRALDAVRRHADVTVEKNVPHGGGLGGGSADAAAVLRWAGCDDMEVAVTLGADVPFCLVGGRARVRGIGETVEPLSERPGLVTLFVPPLRVSTPAVYRAYDQLAATNGDANEWDRVNDLETAAIAVEPRLAEWRDRIEGVVGVRPTLAGSGATWFVFGDHAPAATRLPGATVVVTSHV